MKSHIAFVVFLVAQIIHAQPRSVYNAEKEAKAFLFSQESSLRRKVTHRNISFDNVINDKSVYVFNDTINECFVIVSKDDRMKTILGYCDKTCYDAKNIPIALTELINAYNKEYDYLQGCGIVGDKLDMPSIPDVEPMLSTSWGQGHPYNDMCPNSCPSGCVATAMAQIMKYYNYPNEGKGFFSYVTSTRSYPCSFDFSTPFAWEDIQDKYSAYSSSSKNNQAVAKLMYACGVSVGMDYNTNGSGAFAPDVPYAIINYFNYNPNAVYYSRAFFRTDDWYTVLCDELKEKRPVLYCGSDYSEGGHAFIIDGCNSSTGKFHVNWGWNSNYDGYYELDALDPNYYRFSLNQSMIVRFTPEMVGENEDVFYMEKFIPRSHFKLNERVIFDLNEIYCFSNQASSCNKNGKFYGMVGLGLYDEQKTFIKSLAKTSIDGLNLLRGYRSITLDFLYDTSTFDRDGTYYIAPYVVGKKSQIPTRVRTSGGETDFYPITVKNGVVNDENPSNDDDEYEIAEWMQDFEEGIPVSWRQEQTKGSGKWVPITPLTYSDKQPKPASGYSYLSMDYSSSGLIDLPATVTKLVSNRIVLNEESEYVLSFACRKFSSKLDSNVALKVYLLKGDDDWQLINESQITNSKDWKTLKIGLEDKDFKGLAIEGSVDYGSRLLVDNIKICRNNTNSIETKKHVVNNSASKCSTYSLQGIPIVNIKGIKIMNGKKVLVNE